MTDKIMDTIQKILDLVGVSGNETLILSPQAFNSSLYNGSITIMNNAIMPIAYVILGLLFVLELYNVTIRTDAMAGTLGMEIPFKIMFKLVLCKIALESTELILMAIFAISTEIIGNIGNAFGPGGGLSQADMGAIRSSISSMSFHVRFLTAIEVSIIYYVVAGAMIFVRVIMYGRMIQVYIMLAISPIPMATFPNQELSSIGKNFLKSFASVSIQGVIIFIALAMFPLMMGDALVVEPGHGDMDVISSLGSIILYIFMLVMAVFTSGKLAKSITNAM